MTTALRHEFVESAPTRLEDGVLYVSMPFATAIHLCCCGCGHEVVTPLSPTDWQMWFDGESISLTPSIGNWSFECGSHYWIQRNQVRWASGWTRDQIEAGRARDRRLKDAFFGVSAVPQASDVSGFAERQAEGKPWWRSLFRLRGRRPE